MSKDPSAPLLCTLVGTAEFCRRMTSVMTGQVPHIRPLSASYSDAWGSIIATRPSTIVLEIGFLYTDRIHNVIRALLSQARERFGDSVYIIVALTDSSRFFFGGDLLYSKDNALSPSAFIDTFIASPPGLIPSIPLLSEQLIHALLMMEQEFRRRSDGKPALPALGASGWVQSLADPRSRELWMRWLPRYASYTNENPIIIGQTGTGKTNLAFALHRLSERKGQFVGITPRDFSSSELVQAELFGAVAGAYTGAVDKWGLVKSAEKGTLFIDELQSIDKDLQGKLITFIENKAYRRVGSAESVSADVRFVFASNRTLDDMMTTDVLRHDFAYRLERVQLELAPLAKRRLDVSAALAYALAKIRRQRPHSFAVSGMNQSAYRLLFSHLWPGNLRQLENVVAQLCEFADLAESPLIDETNVSALFESKARGISTTVSDIVSLAAYRLSRSALRGEVASVDQGLDSLVTYACEAAIEASGGDLDRAADLVGQDSKLLRLVTEAAHARAGGALGK